jgi:hypothetical protein
MYILLNTPASDGSNETTATIDKSTYEGKLMAYFSFDSGTTVEVEPEGGF